MGLFDKLIPQGMPPEILAMLANPAALGEQVKLFYTAATGLLDAVATHRDNAGNVELSEEAYTDMILKSEQRIYDAADAFRLELNKLPKLDKVSK